MAGESLAEFKKRIKAVNTLAETEMIEDSMLFESVEPLQTPVPIINVALSGRLDGGLFPGVMMIAAESKRFKSAFGLLLAKSFQDAHEDGMVMFYDTEQGTPRSYWESFGIDLDRVMYKWPTNIEEMGRDIMKLVNATDRDCNKLLILIDSIGNLPTMHELKIVEEGEGKTDMARSKVIRSFFRSNTGLIAKKRVYCVVINHVYSQQSQYAPQKVSGGEGGIYASNDVWVIGRRVDSEGKGEDKVIHGNDFIIRIEKSRRIKERSAFPVNVSYQDGIQKWSGLFDIAEFGGFIKVASKGFYTIDGEKKFRRSAVEFSDDFWTAMCAREDFQQFVTDTFSLSTNLLVPNADRE